LTKLFGTNGIRGIANQDINSELAMGIGKALGTLLKKTIKKPKVAIGTDARISKDMLKTAITSGLLSTGCNVTDIGLTPTPTLQYTVKKKDYDSGIMITASHNPPEYNGIKGFNNDGTEFLNQVEEKIEEIYFNKKFNHANWKNIGKQSTYKDPIKIYIKAILSKINVDKIKRKKYHIVLDCGNGAGGIVTPILLKKLGCKITKLYCKPDGTFPGHNSEPLPENLTEIIQKVPELKADIGVAQDGDADRAIFIDEHGTYISGDKTLSLAAKYITKQKKKSIIVTPVTTSNCLWDTIKEYQTEIIQTPVGSPIVAQIMKEKKAIFGGEENGGLIFPELQYTRDSCMSIAKILEIMANENKTLSELIKEIPTYETIKIKIPCPNKLKKSINKKILPEIKKNKKIIKIDQTDGIKIYHTDGWILLRPSGTEPIYRIYSESKNKEKAKELANHYKKKIEEIIKKT
jgi:phosphomannomutase/phosphoglucomutase